MQLQIEDEIAARSLAAFQQDIRQLDSDTQWALSYLTGTDYEAKAGKVARGYEAAKAELAKFESTAQSAIAELDNLKGDIEFGDHSLDKKIARLERDVANIRNTRSRLRSACLGATAPLREMVRQLHVAKRAAKASDQEEDEALRADLSAKLAACNQRIARRKGELLDNSALSLSARL